ncbi:glycosyltransferase family 4 protein [Roseiflexus sp.]|uniref:glycosyltransferase family 4 protein n=1 Tax=Roseiflexus sp. TaxID=2562120 RepID=UPI0021DD7011|nr:glycosyltransferase family 4 protein [Roseiflexus sp.]GIV99276.1 MAG: glycosyl transferase family 1 [Roseiflexus sp.]
MRILVLTSWWPEPADNGIKLRIRHLLRAIARRCEIHLVALTHDGADTTQRQEVDQLCASAIMLSAPRRNPRRRDVIASLWHIQPASVRVRWDPQWSAVVRERVATLKPDIVLAMELSTAIYAHDLPGVVRILDDPELVELSEWRRAPSPARKLRAWLTWYRQCSYVRYLLRSFAACSVVSEAELDLVRRLAPANTRLAMIPNGAEIGEGPGNWGEPQPDTLIYPGSLTYSANLDAVHYFLNSIFPHIRRRRPDVRLRLTGRAEPEHLVALPSLEGVDVLGFVPDIRSEVARAWCEVVPLREGSGTRLKVLEALALGTPVVSTPKGVEGLDLEHGRHVMIADTPESFADATLRVLEQPELRAQLASQGRQRVVERYDWRVIGQQMNDLLGEVVERYRWMAPGRPRIGNA